MKRIRYNRLSIVLDEEGLTQKDLAILLGAKGDELKDKISSWCTNRHQPSIQTLYKIAFLLRINLQSLLESTYWENELTQSPAQLLKEKKRNEKPPPKKKRQKKL